MLGSDIKALAEECGYTGRIYDLPEFDITVEADLEKMVAENDFIINCAAYTAVDQAETETEICQAVNADAIGILGKVAKTADKYVLHISTDFVFGDDGCEPLIETDVPCPLGVYGATKLHGEELLELSECRHAIIRVQWTYGLHGKHFVSKIADLAERLDKLKVVDDQWGSPTPTSAVAKAVMCFIEWEIEGLYHFAAKGYASRYEVAKFILEKKGIGKGVEPCSSSEFSAPAARPLNSRFNCSKIDQVLDFERPDWQDALGDFLDKTNNLGQVS